MKEVLRVPFDANRLGKVIKDARTNLKLTQEQFAERVEISHRYVAKIENEGKLPSLEVLSRIVHTLSIPPSAVFGSDTYSDNRIEHASALITKCSDREIDAIIAMLESFGSDA
jgi:transcriptional regulator with XRE-family HTH domain